MAHGYLSYQDARGESSILSDIAKGIGRRIKKSSDLAAKERRYAEAKAEAEGTSLDEAGVGRGYFFQRALGSSFGGDRLARTRGRFAKTPTKGIDPTGTQASRFRGGFDYSYSETPIVRPKTALPLGKKGGALSKRAAGGALAAALRGSAYSGNRISRDEAINPDVVGGSMTNVGPFRGKRLNDDNFMASNATVDVSPISSEVIRDDGLSLPTSALARRPDVGGQLDTFSDIGGGGGSGEIVQAIDRLTMVTMRLVAATEAQTDSQQQIAANQQDQAEKLAARAKSDAEKARIGDIDTETRGLAYRKLNASKGLGGLFGGLGGGLLGAGANLLGSGLDLMGGRYMRRGVGGKRMPGARRRLAGMKANKALKGLKSGRAAGVLGKLGSKQASKLGVKTVGKGLAKGGLKMLGKKIPVVGLGLAAIFAAQRAMEGDLLGAGLELASGAASTVPGVGTAASFGLDAALMARDVQAMERGGIPTQDNQLVMVNDGKHARTGTREAVIPLDRKTFAMFGDGILDSQKRNKSEYSKLQAAGLSEYYDKQNGWEKFAKGMMDFFDLSKFNPFRDPNASGSPRDTFAGQDWNDVDMSTSAKNRVMSRVLPWRKNQAPPTTTMHRQLGNRAPSNFGENRGSYTHMGADLGMDEGSPVMAIQDGTVMEAYGTGYGKAGGAVKIRHEDGSGYVYGHLSPTGGLKPGDKVKEGDEIGKLVFYPGPQGQNYTHLHLERYSDINKMSGAVDPIGFMLKENIQPTRRQAAPGTKPTPPPTKKDDQAFLPLDYNAATPITTPQLIDSKVASLSDSTSLFTATASANPTIVPVPVMTPQGGESPARSVDVAQLGGSADSQGSDIWSKSYLRLMS